MWQDNLTVNAQAKQIYNDGLRQYMLKVYNYMTAGLLITALTAFLAINTSLINLFFDVNETNQVIGMSAFGWIAMLSPLFLVFAFNWVAFKGNIAQAQMVYWAFSALMGVSIAPVLIIYTGASVTRIFLITAAMFGSMSIYGYTTKKDLSSIGSFMIMGLWGIIIASIINIFLKSPGLYYALSIISVLVFTVLTAADTQKIRTIYAESDSSEHASKKAIFGALALYLDFINMFLALLRLFGDRR